MARIMLPERPWEFVTAKGSSLLEEGLYHQRGNLVPTGVRGRVCYVRPVLTFWGHFRVREKYPPMARQGRGVLLIDSYQIIVEYRMTPDSQFQFVDHETCVKLGGHSFFWPPPLFPGAFRPQQPAAPEVQDSSPEQPIPVPWPDGEITLDDLKKTLGRLKGRRNRKMPKFDTEGGFRF